MFANRGVDVHNGGEGNDRLWALARRDRLAPDGTGDTLNGGPGNDTFRTRDGQPDKVDCGPGQDRVFADHKDIVVDATAANANGSCERVVRRGPRRRDRTDERKAERDDDRFEREGEKGKRRPRHDD
jgi:Ca2+-binding RTX toxin-like protein